MKKSTVLTIRQKYEKKEPLTVLTAHDYPSAMFVEKSGTDILLVGDSLAMVALGYQSTTSITMEEMLHHCRAVARGATLPFLVGDMPFGSYQVNGDLAVQNAVRFFKEGNMESVKLEGGVEKAEIVDKIVKAGIPVLGHIGLTPQTTSALGGYRVQGKTAQQAIQLLKDAQALEEAGCFAVVLEAIPDLIANEITKRIHIPTIGIGAGSGTSGQVLVQNDMLGIFDRFVPKFCKQYANIGETIQAAIKEYNEEVRKGNFPAKEHCYPISQDELQRFYDMLPPRA